MGRRCSCFPWSASSDSERRAPSVAVRHKRLIGASRRPDVAAVGLTRRELDLIGRQVAIRHKAQKVADDVQPSPPLVIGLHDPPRRLLRCPCGRTCRPSRSEYPTQRERDSRSIGLSFQRRVGSLRRTWNLPLLLGVAHREPVLDEEDAERMSICSKAGAERKNSSTSSAGVAKPITRSTPARLYQLRSKRRSRPPPAGGRRSAGNTTASAPGRTAQEAPRAHVGG